MQKENDGSTYKKSSFLYLFISLWFFFACILTYLIAKRVNQTILDQSKRCASEIAKSIYVSQVRIVEESKLIFEAWADEIRNFSEVEQDPCQANIIRFVKENPTYIYYAAADSEGLLLCGWAPIPEGTDIKDRKYFKDALATKGLSVGEYQEGILTKIPSINLAYPILDEQEEVKTVIILAINLDWFDQRIHDLNLPYGTELSITDYTGKILATYPKPEVGSKGGQSVIIPKLLSIILSEEVEVIDGIEIGEKENIYAFQAFGGIEKEQTALYSVVTFPGKINSKELQRVTIFAYLVGATLLFSGLASANHFLRGARPKKNNS